MFTNEAVQDVDSKKAIIRLRASSRSSRYKTSFIQLHSTQTRIYYRFHVKLLQQMRIRHKNEALNILRAQLSSSFYRVES